MKTLALNLGNTSLFGGLFDGEKLVASFRAPVREAISPRDFRSSVVARSRGGIDRVVFGSVVPELTQRLVAQSRRQLGLVPLQLTATSRHGLKIGYHDPRQLGVDRLAAALGARKIFPRRNVIVVDCGTATTVTALRRDGTLQGGAIFPGLALWPSMLAASTAQLPLQKLDRPRRALGRSTAAGLQSGFFHGHAGAIRELVRRIRTEAFGRAAAVVVGTGGHAGWFSREGLFEVQIPELVLIGLNQFAADTEADRL